MTGEAKTSAEEQHDVSEVTPEQIAAFGGELDDIDLEDLDGLDRGDDLEPQAKTEEEDEEETEKDEEETEKEEEEEEDEEETEKEEDEEETEKEEDEEETEKEEDEEEKKPAPKDNRIPKARFDEVNERMKAAEAKLAELEAQLGAKEQVAENKFDFEAAEKEYAELLLDGDIDAALTKRKEINAALEEEFLQRAAATSQQVTQATTEQQQMQELAQVFEEEFPAFNPNSDEYNQEAVEEVQVQLIGNLQSGKFKNGAEAFAAAIEKTARLYGLEPQSAKAEKAKQAERKKPAEKKQVKEKVKMAKKAPKSLAEAGKSGEPETTDTVDINKLTDEELEALPAATLARLRGDFV